MPNDQSQPAAATCMPAHMLEQLEWHPETHMARLRIAAWQSPDESREVKVKTLRPPKPDEIFYCIDMDEAYYAYPAVSPKTARFYAEERLLSCQWRSTLSSRFIEAFQNEIKTHGANGMKKAMSHADCPQSRRFSDEVRAYALLRHKGGEPNLVEHILDETGGYPWEALINDPYRFYRRSEKLMVLDHMLLNFGMSPLSVMRHEAWLFAALEADTEQRLSGVRLEDALKKPPLSYGRLDKDAAISALRNLDSMGACKWDDKYIWHRAHWNSDATILRKLNSLTPTKPKRSRRPKLPDTLSDEQSHAVQEAGRHPISILTGGPGVGKTTVMRYIADHAAQAGRNIMLCAPTGLAAQRLQASCGRKAMTIHRLLKADKQALKGGKTNFAHNQNNPLPPGDVFLDEASMLDRELFEALMYAMPKNGRLLLSGDPDQLQPVGFGAVFRDLIDLDKYPVLRLTSVFRQKVNSGVLDIADALRRGHPEWGVECAGVTWCPTMADSSDRMAQWLAEVESNPDRQWLSAKHDGAFGVIELNRAAQSALNNEGEACEIGQNGMHIARVGDRVRQTKNNYKLGVMNGAIGKVTDLKDGQLTIAWEHRKRVHDAKDCTELDLAYVITVHASQGSEFDDVGLSIVENGGWSKEHLYTAITRAKKTVSIFGEPDAYVVAGMNSCPGRPTSLTRQKNGTDAQVEDRPSGP